MWTQKLCTEIASKINNIELSSICKEKPDFVLQMLDGFVVVGLLFFPLQSQTGYSRCSCTYLCIKTASRKLVCIFLLI